MPTPGGTRLGPPQLTRPTPPAGTGEEPPMSVEVNNESGYAVDEAEFAELGRYVLDAMHLHPETELSIMLVEVDMMAELHVRWLVEPGPTDVLSLSLIHI